MVTCMIGFGNLFSLSFEVLVAESGNLITTNILFLHGVSRKTIHTLSRPLLQ